MQIRDIFENARGENRSALIETEGLAVLDALGFTVPQHLVVQGAAEVNAARIQSLPGDRVVVKVVSEAILHKSDAGGVEIVQRDPAAIQRAITTMKERFRSLPVECFSVHEFVSYDHSPGGEFLLGLRWTDDFGPVVVLGLGGVYTELLGANVKDGLTVVSARERDRVRIQQALARTIVTKLATEALRNLAPRVSMDEVVEAVIKLQALAELCPAFVSEFEINPLVVSRGKLVALDVVAKLGTPPAAPEADRPIAKLKNLFEPSSVAVAGVSTRMNPGRVILNNLVQRGFPRERIFIVKPGSDAIDGCRCFPDVASLPERVDLLVLSVSAEQVPDAIGAVVRTRKAESIIVIPGGLEEKEGTDDIVLRMREALRESRTTDWKGPVVNGGNSLGVRSLPGRYDTMFIPDYKLGIPSKPASPLAVITQSGAFAISKVGKLSSLNPKYVVTFGNQMDLTVGDYIEYLKQDTDIATYAVYVEGFKPLDGTRFLDAARDITRTGRTVILYKAGRTAAGARASASHTASVAGDYTVTRELARQAGITVAESIADFEDLVMLFGLLAGKHVAGWRLGAVSNAGFEGVTVADNLARFQLATLSDSTVRSLRSVFERARIDTIVDLRNPLDLTPMTADAEFEDAVSALVADPGVDVGVIGCVPLTPALNTLAAATGHREDVFAADSIARRLVEIYRRSRKAWVAVVDGGPLYDPMAHLLRSEGIPTFRTADRAVRLLEVFCAARLGDGT